MAWYPTPNNIGSTLAAPHTPGGSLVLQTGDGAQFVASPSHVPSAQAPILISVTLEDKTTSPSVLTPLAVLEVTSMSGDTIPAGGYTVRWPTSGGDGSWIPNATTVYWLDIALDNEHLEQFRVAIDALDTRVTTAEGTLAGLSEVIDDRVATLLVQGSGITLTYNDVANTLTIAASGGGSAPSDATYIVRTASTALSAETALDTLNGPGLLKFAADGTPSKAVAGTDYLVPTGSGAALTGITAGQVGDLSETIDDRMATLLVQGSGIVLTYDDTANTLTIAAPGAMGGWAPTDATYLVRTGSTELSAETALDTLGGPGLLKFAADGTPSKAVAGTDYLTPTGSGAGLTGITTSQIGGLSESIDDRVATLLVQGSGILLTYDDTANTLTIAATVGGGAPTDATYLVRTGSASLSAEMALDTLGGPGLLKFAADGTPSKAVAGTDYLAPTAIGTTVQAYNGNLTTYAGTAPTVAGLALLDDADAAAQRVTLGLGTAATQAATAFASVTHTHTAADITSGTLAAALMPAFTGAITTSAGSTATTLADGVVTDAKVAAANKDGAAATPSLRTLGTGAAQAAAGNDARLGDARTPTAHAASHQHGGSDEVATATPAASAIPKAGVGGTLAAGWLPDLTQYHTDARALTWLGTRSTTDLPEGTNQYHTEARSRAAVSGAAPLAYNPATGAFSLPAASGTQDGYLAAADWTTFNAKVPSARAITAGTGLTGGGDLSADRTLGLANTAVTPGTYGMATWTVNAQGRLTAATATNTLTTPQMELILEQTGDSYGVSRLRLQNRPGQAGPLFESSVDVIDFGLVGPTTAKGLNLRSESRAAYTASNSSPEFMVFNNDGLVYPTFATFGPNGTWIGSVEITSIVAINTVAQLMVQPGVAGRAGLVVKGTTNQTANLLEVQNTSGVVLWSVSEHGYPMIRVTTAPADAELAVGELAFWFDPTAGAAKLMIKAKNSAGTVVSGSVSLA